MDTKRKGEYRMKMNLQLFGGRGASSGKRVSGGGSFSPVDIENTNLSGKQLKALGTQRWEAWRAVRQSLKNIPETKEPSMTNRQREIYEDVENGNYSSLDKTNKKTFKVVQQKVDSLLYDSAQRVARSDYGLDSDYYTTKSGKRVKANDNFADRYNEYRKYTKISNEMYDRAIKRGLVNR